MVNSPNRMRPRPYATPRSSRVMSKCLLWNAQRVLTKTSKHRIVSKFHADAFTHYHQVGRVSSGDLRDRSGSLLKPYPRFGRHCEREHEVATNQQKGGTTYEQNISPRGTPHPRSSNS
jgi:hypothetical protein